MIVLLVIALIGCTQLAAVAAIPYVAGRILGHRTQGRFIEEPSLRIAITLVLFVAGLLAFSIHDSEAYLIQVLPATAQRRTDHGWPRDLVLVAIDDETIARRGEWPWPAEQQVALLEKLSASEVKTIVWDVPAEDAFRGLTGDSPPAMARVILPVEPVMVPDGPDHEKPPRLDSVHARALRAPLFAIPPGYGMYFKGPPAELVDRAAGVGFGLFRRSESESAVLSVLPCVHVAPIACHPSIALSAVLHHEGIDAQAISLEARALELPGHARLRLPNGKLFLDVIPGGKPPTWFVSAERVLDDPAPAGILRGALAVVHLSGAHHPDKQELAILRKKVDRGLITAYAIRTLMHGTSPLEQDPSLWLAALGILALVIAPRAVNLRGSTLLVCSFAIAGPIFFVLPQITPSVPTPALALASAQLGFLLSTVSSRRAEDDLKRLSRIARRVRLADADVETVSVEARATVALAPGGAAAEAAESPLSALVAGVQLGRYKVGKVVGRGGMGAILLARDEDLDRDVVIKVLDAAEPRAFVRFRREAMTIARLSHPNVVQIHEIGFDARTPFIVMEYVRGGTFSDLLRDPDLPSPLPWPYSTALIAAAARGLGAAHAAGIVHRDVKPANLLLAERRSTQVKVADFGIAKLADSESVTLEGTVLGTVGYLSPEQARGDALDARTDVYSLGVVWYRMLTGKSAFPGNTEQILAATLAAEIPDPRDLNPGIPAPIAEVLARMTDGIPERRPPDGTRVAEVLDALLRSLAGPAPSPALPEGGGRG